MLLLVVIQPKLLKQGFKRFLIYQGEEGMFVSNKKVSVIVPIFKAEKHLNKCVDSILSQTHINIEVILVDDGSPDNCPKICDEYARKNNNVIVIHKENEGAAISRKTGAKQSTGDFLMFVDSDDWIESEYIETMLKLAIENNAEAVIGGFKKELNGDIIANMSPQFNEGLYEKEKLVNKIYAQMLSMKGFYTFGVAPSTWGKLFLGDLVRKQNFEIPKEITQGEDGCFTYSILLDCNNVYITNNTMYIYRDNPISVSKGFNFNLLNETEKLRKCLEEIAKEKQWKIGPQLDEYIAFMCYDIITRALINYNGKFKELRKHLKKYKKTNLPLNILTNINFRKTATFKMKIMFFLLTINLFRPMQIFLRRWIKK